MDQVVYTDADCQIMQVEEGETIATYQAVSSTDGKSIHPYAAGDPFWGIARNSSGEGGAVSVRTQGFIHWKYLVKSASIGRFLDYADGQWIVGDSGLLKASANYLAEIQK